MASKIIQEIKSKKKGIVVVHDKVAIYLDLSNKDKITSDFLASADFDNYLLSFGFLKNTQVSVDMLPDNNTAVILIGNQNHTYEDLEKLLCISSGLPTKVDPDYLASIIGLPPKEARKKISIEKIRNENETLISSIKSEYSKIIKKNPKFNKNRISHRGITLAAIIVVLSIVIMVEPQIHAEVIIFTSNTLLDSGYPTRAFELCNAADFIEHKKMNEDCKLNFLPYHPDPEKAVKYSFEGDDLDLAKMLNDYGDKVITENVGDVPSSVIVYFQTAHTLAEKYHDQLLQSELKTDEQRENQIELLKRSKELMKESGIGEASVMLTVDPVRSQHLYSKNLQKHPDDNTRGQTGHAYATQLVADLQRDDEPDDSKRNYLSALNESTKAISALLDKESVYVDPIVLQITCDSQEDDLSFLDHSLDELHSDGETYVEFTNSLRVIAHVCYGLMSHDGTPNYEKVKGSSTMIIFEKILSDNPSDVNTLLSKSSMLFDILKSNYLKNNDSKILNEVIISYNKVIDEKPHNSIALKQLVLLYHLDGNYGKMQDTLNKLKDNNDKDGALIEISSLYLDSQSCDDVSDKQFYEKIKDMFNDELVLSSFKQQITDKCGPSVFEN